jgi:hypothetical protein
MKKETFFTVAGLLLLFLPFIFQTKEQPAFPWILLLLALTGFLLSFLSGALGKLLQLFSGLSLMVHPLLYSSSRWLLPGAILLTVSGLLFLLNWWRQNEK